MSKTKYMGSKELVDPKTGEVIQCDLIQQDVNGRRNFYIAYMYNVLKLFDVLGGQKFKVVEFIINNMNSDNQVLMTIKELSDKSGISLSTVKRTIKLLEENNLLVRKIGVIMLNPKLFNNKKNYQEQYMLVKYNQIKNESNNDNQI